MDPAQLAFELACVVLEADDPQRGLLALVARLGERAGLARVELFWPLHGEPRLRRLAAWSPSGEMASGHGAAESTWEIPLAVDDGPAGMLRLRGRPPDPALAERLAELARPLARHLGRQIRGASEADGSRAALAITDLRGRVIHVTPTMAAFHGWEVDELLGQSVHTFAPELPEQLSDDDLARLGPSSRRTAHLRKDGSRLFVSSASELLRDPSGRPLAVVITAEGAEGVNAASGIREAEKRYRQLFDRSLAGVVRTSIDGNILDANGAAVRLLGLADREALLARPASDFFRDPRDARRWRDKLLTDGTLTGAEVEIARADGSGGWMLVNAGLAHDETGQPVVEAVLIDISERRQEHEAIAHEALHDQLTDLPNRRVFRRGLEEAIARSRPRGLELAVVFLDLDHFKLVNDALGHEVGDELLRQVAARLRAQLRVSDTLCRLGGDEFTVLATGTDGLQGGRRLAEKLHHALTLPYNLYGRQLEVTVSIGVAVFPHHGNDAETLLRHADAAMYGAKDAGRNRQRMWSPELAHHGREGFELGAALRRCLDEEQLELHFQTVHELAEGAVVGAEALLRWCHPQRGLLRPAQFLPLAEAAGMIPAIGEWCLETAFRQARSWHQAGWTGRLAINLSPRHFEAAGLVDTIAGLLARTAIDPRRTEIEITEAMVLRDLDRAIQLLNELRRLGLRIALDDFGTGNASLNHLHHLPLDSVKLDRSVVRGIATSGRSHRLVDAVVTLAHRLGLRVIAEGVETEAQRSRLIGAGCDEAQGYLLSRPIEPEEMTSRLRAGL